MDKNPPIQGTGVQSLIQENPNASEQPSPYSTTSEPLLQSPGATTTEAQAPRAHTPQQEKPLQWKAYAPQLESSPHSLQLEKARAHQRPITVKNKLILNITVIIFSHPSHCCPRQYLHLHHHAITTPSFQEQFFNTVLEISSAQGPTHWE